MPAALEFRVGRTYNGFKLQRITPVRERAMRVYDFEHTVTGARYVHVSRDDDNNAFVVTFRTPAPDSRGVPHVLEHTVLCGSQKYPVRDPFFHMLKRSLKTFMNAMTADDYTMYPFSTQNKQDYENLLSIYLDATFFPNLDPLDFSQEGVRVELEDPTSLKSRAQLKGIVYNEMKGVFSESDNLFLTELQQKLFADTKTSYVNVSGGHPDAIPDLTYEQLAEFHKTHYHPSNACFISYGSFDPPLTQIESHVLSKFSAQNATAPVKPQPHVLNIAQQAHNITGPFDQYMPPDKQTKFAIAHLCNDVAGDEVDTLALALISMLLFDGPNSIMYEALLTRGLAPAFSPGTGYDSNLRTATFTIGVSGIGEADVETVYDEVEKQLIRFVEKFETTGALERLEAIFNEILIAEMEVTSNYGMNLMMRLSQMFAHNIDISSRLSITKVVEKLRKRCLEDEAYLGKLVQKHLLLNENCISLTMTGDPEYEAKVEQRETERVDAINASLVTKQRGKLVSKAKELAARQAEVDDVECLPSLKISDIDTKSQDIDVMGPNVHKGAGTETYWCLQPTNSILYARAMADVNVLSLEQRQWLPLYTTLLTSMGTQGRDYRELSHELDMATGGLSGSLSVAPDLDDIDKFSPSVAYGTKALATRADTMFGLLHDVLYYPTFAEQPDRLKVLLSSYLASMQQSLQASAHSLAASHAARNLTPAGALTESLSGLSYMEFILPLLARLDDEATLKTIGDSVQDVATSLHRGPLLRTLVTGDKGALPSGTAGCTAMLRSRSKETAVSSVYTAPDNISQDQNTFFAIPSQVNYVATALRCVPFRHPDFAKLRVLSELLSSNFLHKEVREKNGAYGASAGISSTGVLTMFSYRDPSVSDTIDTYHRAAEWATDAKNITDTDIEHALLSIFSSIDAPTPPGSKAVGFFSMGITNEDRQLMRDRLLAIDRAQVMDVASRYLAREQMQRAPVTVVGNEAMAPDNFVIRHPADALDAAGITEEMQ
jgi:presequence protease